MSEVRIPDEIERLATMVVNAALSVHRSLGPGLLESAYHECLGIELSLAGLQVKREQALPLTYRGHIIQNAYRLDLLVNDQLLVELKAIDAVQAIHRVQVTTYLRLLKLPLGLLINFNVPLIKDGISRVLNLDFKTSVETTHAASAPKIMPSSPALAPSRLRA
ncbi:MAG: GxxExxY protein [Opitutaceae bacterium]|nr:GxxExxY protein [Opitutaceae bacterium]